MENNQTLCKTHESYYKEIDFHGFLRFKFIKK